MSIQAVHACSDNGSMPKLPATMNFKEERIFSLITYGTYFNASKAKLR